MKSPFRTSLARNFWLSSRFRTMLHASEVIMGRAEASRAKRRRSSGWRFNTTEARYSYTMGRPPPMSEPAPKSATAPDITIPVTQPRLSSSRLSISASVSGSPCCFWVSSTSSSRVRARSWGPKPARSRFAIRRASDTSSTSRPAAITVACSGRSSRNRSRNFRTGLDWLIR